MGVELQVKGRKSDLLTIVLLVELKVFIRMAPAVRSVYLSLSLAASIVTTRDDGPVKDSYAQPFFTFFFIC